MQHRNALTPGYKLHWYEIEKVLGIGGFGITYLARDLNLDRLVAIKEYLPSEFAIREQDTSVQPASEKAKETYQWGMDRFIKEAQTLSKFEHPNIVRVYAVFEENNTGYMVMAYEEGRSLKALLKEQGVFDEETLRGWLMPILDGLALVHQQGFIHRDIKPDNLYIRNDGSPVLLDFGSARQSIGEETKTLTSLVSPGYAPFEQYYAKSDEQGPWTDIYGLGATLYHGITGKKPDDAVTRSKSIIDGSVDQLPSVLGQYQENYSSVFLKAVDHAIQFKPEQRPQSVDAWKQEFLQPEPALESTVIAGNDAQADEATRVVSPAAIAQRTADNTKPKVGLMAAIVGCVLLLAAGGFYFIGEGAEPDDGLVASADAPAQSNDSLKAKPNLAGNANEGEQAQLEQAGLEQARQEAQQQAQEQQRLLEAQQEQKRIAEEKQRQEAARIEQQRLEQQRLENQRKEQLRKEQERKEQERIAQQKAIEDKIVQSKRDMQTRYAKAPDSFTYSSGTAATLLANGMKSTTVNVPAAANQWQHSGVQIERGKTYRVLASGNWKMGSLCKATDAGGDNMYSMACWDMGGQTVAGFSHGALIGKIGTESLPFYVGKRLKFTADRSGVLYFMGNDTAAFIKDNSGQLSVSVSLVE